MSNSPVQPVQFGDALNLTLDQYYDLLKIKVGGLGADEFLQLKLVADPVDISDEKYRYFSQFNLLMRCDLAIEPEPVSSQILTGADELSRVYGRFLQRLRNYVVIKEATPEQQVKIADLDQQSERASDKREEYIEKLYLRWERHCRVTGTSMGDTFAFLQWRANQRETRLISDLTDEIKLINFKRKSLVDACIKDPEDLEIVQAETDYLETGMRLRYPLRPDYEYLPTVLTLQYLASLDAVSTAQFSDRRAITWNMALATIQTTGAGAFTATMDRTTSASSSITRDWSYSGGGGWGPFKARASASEHTAISEDFKTGTTVTLEAKAAFKVQIIYPAWFQPQIFKHKRLKENIKEFADFFGPDGTLLYYPTHIILIRGFNVEFKNSQNWKYDYLNKFSASGGGGFSAFGISFNSSAGYGSHVEKHKVDVSNTSLKFSDGESTLRFVGYTVKKNTIFEDSGDGVDGTLSPISEPGPGSRAIGSKKKNSPQSPDSPES